ITAIHDEMGYDTLRQLLSQQFNLDFIEPNIQIYDVHVKTDRTIILRHIQIDHRPLDEASTQEVLKHFHYLWGFDVILESVSAEGTVRKIFRCPPIMPSLSAES
ncbi:MAG: SpoVR family protein, partial [Gammaproteobacteria bacterium]|nr:SpoVR family protein [Gammaproteobacteria bacterium]